MSALVLGLGNILLSDEGIGVHTVKKIREEWSFLPDVEIIDGGTLGLDLLPYFEKYSRILIIDAVDFKKEAGYIGIVKGADILKSFSKKLSVHHIGLSDILFACQLIGIKPTDVIIIGIQPKSIDMGLQLTNEISSKIPELIKIAIENLENWDIKCVSQSPQKS